MRISNAMCKIGETLLPWMPAITTWSDYWADSTVTVAESDYYGQCTTQGWTDFIAVASGDIHTMVLKGMTM